MSLYPTSTAANGIRSTAVGAHGGGSFCDDARGVLIRLTVSLHHTCVGRIQFWFADGMAAMVGDKALATAATELKLAVGEFITKLALWEGPWMQHGDYHRARLVTRIEIETSRHQVFGAGSTDRTTRKELQV